MRVATVAQIKKELKQLSPDEVTALVLRLARFKKDSKELLTYLLFEAHNEDAYIAGVQEFIDVEFEGVNKGSVYFMKKNMRRILGRVRKYIRYSGKPETEVELLLYFCEKMNGFEIPINQSKVLMNLYERLVSKIISTIGKLEEDLQFDYEQELKSRLDIALPG